MLVLSKRALMMIGIAQSHSLGARGEMFRITLPYVPGIPSRFAQRPYEVSADRRGSNMKLLKPRQANDDLPRGAAWAHVRLVHMRGGTAAIREDNPA